MFNFLKKLKKNPEVKVDETKIDEILSRNVSAIYPDTDSLKKALMSGRRLRIYVGADATSPHLHLGHSANFILLEKLRRMGHEVIILFGDFTAQIGDPTDKSAARVRLTPDQVKKNIKTWKKQIKKVISLNDRENPVRIVRNSKWLSKLSFSDVVDLASNFTVQQMIERDMFEKRLKEGKPIHLHEFFYPLMQGYDSVHLDVDLEIGGTDQTFNMLAGRTLLSKIKDKNKFVVTMNLLEDPASGKKMSKSEGNTIDMDDNPTDMFGKVMAISDELIVPIYTSATFVSTKELYAVTEKMCLSNTNPRDIKIQLAKEIVTMYHSAKAADKAEQNFINTFSKKDGKGGISDDAVEISAVSGDVLADKLVESGVVDSKSEYRRLVENGAITNLDSGEKITDPRFAISGDINLKIGKKKFAKISCA
jgi:tyrosyl-tRNA synthetase